MDIEFVDVPCVLCEQTIEKPGEALVVLNSVAHRDCTEDGTIHTRCSHCNAVTTASAVNFRQFGLEVEGSYGDDLWYCRCCGEPFTPADEARIVIEQEVFGYPRGA